MMISCEKATIICNKAQYREATLFEILKLKIHVILCRTCAKFTKQNTEFTSLCEKANLKSLSEQDKLKMKQKLHKGQ